MEQTHTILTRNGNKLSGMFLKQEEVSTEGTIYRLSEYDIEKYGNVEFLENPRQFSGEFRRVRSMMPFDNLDKRGRDFDWSLYSQKLDIERKLANAFILNFQKFRKEGKGLYIYSGTKGSGKTLLACCLVNEIVNTYDVSVKFISVLDFLDLTKKGYGNQTDKEEADSIRKSSVLVLDDIGVEISKEWVSTTLYQLINYRYSSKLMTIITSNLCIEDLKVDDRVKDRINAMCIPLHIPEVSIRSIKARQANSEFVNSVI